jgi:hypothetical protein
LLRRSRPWQALERRRANYEVLLEALGDRVPTPFDRLPAGACPLYLPVTVGDKQEAIAELARRQVRGLDLWLVPHPSLPVDEFPGAARRRATTIGLGVHQGLGPRQLDRVIWAARESLGARQPDTVAR